MFLFIMPHLMGKYGKKYDLTIARRSFAGKDFVSLNVMWYALYIPAHHCNHNLTTCLWFDAHA